MCWVCTLNSLAQTASPQTAEPNAAQPLWAFAHTNPKTLIGMDVRRIRESPFLQALEKQWLTKLSKPVPGIELLDKIERILISSPGSNNAGSPEEPPILVAVRGQFDLMRVSQILRERGVKSQTFDSVVIYRPEGRINKEFAIAVIDAQTILAGDVQSIFSSIERLRLPPRESTDPLLGRAQDLDVKYDFWALMSPGDGLALQRVPFAAFVQGLKAFEAGISVTDGLSITASILMVNEYKAREFRDQLGKLLNLAAKDKATRPEVALIARKPKLSLQGPRIVLSMRMDQNELNAGLRTLQAPRIGKALPPSKPQRQVIRIDGLDEGPRELLVPQNR